MSKEKQFFTSRACDGVALWSLHNPVRPEYGHWAWGHLVAGRVTFIRTMTDHEIMSIRQQYLVWGEKIHNEPWALVVGYASQTGVMVNTYQADMTGGVGV